jgi:iron complex transport system substrate-binding protein
MKRTMGWLSGLTALLFALALLLGACGDTPTNTAVATTRAATTTLAATTSATTTTVAPTTAAAKVTYPLTITDDAKRSIKFEKAPSKIISLAPSNTELLFALGLGDKIVGVDDYSNYPEGAKTKEKIGSYSKTNLEKVASLSPDMILAAGITSKDLLTALESRNLTVVVFNPSNLDGVAANMKLLGQIGGVPEKADVAVAEFNKKLEEVAAKVKTASAKPKIFYELDPTGFTVGPGSFIDDMIKRAGGQNIVTDGTNPYPQLNQEVVVTSNPDVIIVGDDSGGESSPEKILARPAWQTISAVKNKRVVAIPRAALGVEQIAKALYPDLFK